jgi:hypothetical protein
MHVLNCRIDGVTDAIVIERRVMLRTFVVGCYQENV